MKGKAAALIAGLILGGTTTGLAVSRYTVPRGGTASFAGLPNLLCVNKLLAFAYPDAPKGSAAVRCITASNDNPDYVVSFTRNRLSVYSPGGQIVYRARMVTPR